jgi:DNA-binding MarR family transcriptional regulator
VDLKGRLSNLSRAVGSLAQQGSQRSCQLEDEPRTSDSGPRTGSASGASKQRGRLSNPVQRRLTDNEIDDLVTQYQAGATIDVLAEKMGLHRTTVIDQLERQGVPRRSPRKLTDEVVSSAVRRYTSGETLAEIAEHLHVSPTTLTRELRLAGTTIRPRGRPRWDTR